MATGTGTNAATGTNGSGTTAGANLNPTAGTAGAGVTVNGNTDVTDTGPLAASRFNPISGLRFDSNQGMRITDIARNSLGAQAGLQRGDITSFAGQAVTSPEQLNAFITNARRTGAPVQVQFSRDGVTRTENFSFRPDPNNANGTFTGADPNATSAATNAAIGEAQALSGTGGVTTTDQGALTNPTGTQTNQGAAANQGTQSNNGSQTNQASQNNNGVGTIFNPRDGFRFQAGGLTLSNVSNSSLAFRSGFRSGDQIVSINGQDVSSRGNLNQALRNLRNSNQPLEVTVDRNGTTQTLEFTMPSQSSTSQSGSSSTSGQNTQPGTAQQ